MRSKMHPVISFFLTVIHVHHEQMNELDKFLENDKSIQLLSVIEVVVSEDVARDRVLGRARGADDDEKVFNNRMNVYTAPLADIQSFYESKKSSEKNRW